jgi:hypothetical protein
MKQELKGRSFADIAEVQRGTLAAFDSIPVEDFWKCFQQWQQNLHHCI